MLYGLRYKNKLVDIENRVVVCGSGFESELWPTCVEFGCSCVGFSPVVLSGSDFVTFGALQAPRG